MGKPFNGGGPSAYEKINNRIGERENRRNRRYGSTQKHGNGKEKEKHYRDFIKKVTRRSGRSARDHITELRRQKGGRGSFPKRPSAPSEKGGKKKFEKRDDLPKR